MEGGRNGGREEWREGGREGREGGMEGREGGMEGGRKGGEGWREGGKETYDLHKYSTRNKSKETGLCSTKLEDTYVLYVRARILH